MIHYIDLFCGLGAFHTAFSKSDKFKCVFACDIDEGIRRIYNANYGLQPHGDIRTVTTLPKFDILCAGFPCQPFSIAGNRDGFQDTEKGNLFYDILRIIDANKPELCILENVKNLETHDDGRTFQKIRTELETRGYNVTWRVLNAAHFGSPQARERIFIVASRRPFEIPSVSVSATPVASILDADEQRLLDLSKYNLVEKHSAAKSKQKPHILYDLQSKTTGKGGRQGERVYDIQHVGVTVCASSGGPGAKTGLYQTPTGIRRLNVKETLRMFGFPDSYTFPNTTDEDALFYLGNSIVVNVVDSFVRPLEEYFEHRH